jgi:tetratricopeptide (TPR) repeat protein
LQGKEFADQKMYALAEEKLQAALKKDSNFLPALIKMSELFYRNMRYDESLQLAKKALSIDTHDGAANYYYGLVNEQLGNIIDAKDGFDIATLSQEYRSAAYIELSRIYFKEKNWGEAVSYAAKALDFNRYAMEAYELQAVAYRYQKDSLRAKQVLNTMFSFDHLNHFARFESYLWQSSDVNEKEFVSGIRNELPFETFLELAINYFDKGCLQEAEKVLQLSPSNMLVYYWLAFIENKQGKSFSSELSKANESSPAFIFPFRSETAEVLQWAIQQNAAWKPKYLLALIYKDRNRIIEANNLFRQLGNTPDYAPFYTARALLLWKTDKDQAQIDLAKALSLNKEEWRYHRLLAEYYLEQQQYEKVVNVTKNFYRSHPQNYIMGMLYAKALLRNKNYTASDQLLSHLNVIPFEGATEGRELYKEAKLMQAVQAFKKKNYKRTLQFVDEARKWPENLGVGKPYDEDVDERLEDWISYLCYQQIGNNSKAQSFLQKIIHFYSKENTEKNFIPANHLVTAWAIEKTINREQAIKWLNEQTELYPDNEVLQWTKATFQKNKTNLPEDKKDASVRVLEEIQMISQ